MELRWNCQTGWPLENPPYTRFDNSSNLAGQLVSEKYPSGRTVNVSYDANGRLATVSDASRNYLNGISFNSQTLPSQMNLGNGTNQTFAFNERLQMTNQTLSRGAEVLQKYNYGYGQIDGSGNLDTSKNNGQLAKIESFIGATQQWTQKFSYDSVGRLSEAREYKGDPNNTNILSYKQKFEFDRFGNLYRKNASNPTSGQESPLPYTPIENADIDKHTNRFTSVSGTAYNDAGQVVTDSKFRAMSFGYDANGRMVKATKANFPDALSVYDALGNRVATKINDVWQFVIYDAFGKLVAEYGGLNSSDEGGVKYVLSDWQGSVRASLSNSGYVKSRTDYQAFGEEIQSGVGLRTAAQGFGGGINTRQGYGLTERDDSTGLNHTWFRKNENRAGRWTSPDPYKGSIRLGSPQSFNRYSYVENQPANFVDPSGLFILAPRRQQSWLEMCWLLGICGNPHSPSGGEEFPGGGGGGEPFLLFDGCHLTFYDSNGNAGKSWKAVSGKPGTTKEDQEKQNEGPIPETATYTVGPAESENYIKRSDPIFSLMTVPGISISVPYITGYEPVYQDWSPGGVSGAWGENRTRLRKRSGDTGTRDGFYIHGGTTPGSAGCIDLTDGNNDFHQWLKNYGRRIKVEVKYTCNPW